jgi:uncharacterized lipoprotein NlpE involved in copper resistance
MRALLVAFAACSFVLVGCNKPLDEDQCTKLVDKMVDLAAADEPSGANTDKLKNDVKADRRTLQNVKDTCVGKMTKSQYECVMDAKTFKDASACDGK